MARTKEDVVAADTAVAPRGRGRPSKASKTNGVKKGPYVPTGRPRGRPKSDGPLKTKPYVPTGRPRGRPVKVKRPAPNGGKGRPRKNPDAPLPTTTVSTTPKKRGRPSKKAAEEEKPEAEEACK